MKKKGFTLIELLVVIAIIAMLLAILMPALNKVKKIAQRVVCGTNLKGLGTAQAVYANDYEDQYVRQGGSNNNLVWTSATPGWQVPDFNIAAQTPPTVTVGASLYLLVREADVSPKSFVCNSGGQTPYDGKTTLGQNPDLVELWDFGHETVLPGTGPRNCVSYSYHFPYGKNAASGAASASFAVMADKNPWFDPKLTEQSMATSTGVNWIGNVERMYEYFDTTQNHNEKWKRQIANSYPHSREGQNVLYGDGHSAYETTPDVGVRHDNIYTQQIPNGTEPAVRCGKAGVPGIYAVPAAGTAASAVVNCHPLNGTDSLLVNDDD